MKKYKKTSSLVFIKKKEKPFNFVPLNPYILNSNKK